MNMKIYWSGSTRYHNWYHNKQEILVHFIEQIKEIVALNKTEWLYEGIEEKNKKKVKNEFDIVAYIKKIKEKKGGSSCINIGGEFPYHWEMNLLLFPFVKSINQIRGINTFNLFLGNDSSSFDVDSELLAESFKKMHSIDNTEFAMIHPHKRYNELNDVIGGAYENPVTFGPMFCGVFWLMFLGKEHLDLFDRQKLKEIDCYEKQWLNDNDCLYIRMTQNVMDSVNSETEEKMFRLTEQFRAALL